MLSERREGGKDGKGGGGCERAVVRTGSGGEGTKRTQGRSDGLKDEGEGC
jgi:hypothetical protein